MKEKKIMSMVVFDNNGKTQDRYTIIFENGDIYTADENPFSANGIGFNCGNIGENYFITTVGHAWRGERSIQKITSMIREQTRQQIELARNDKSWMGEEVRDISLLPENVRKYINQVNDKK